VKGVKNIRTLAISDIHGCYDQFNELLKKVNYSPSEDKLILLGDYIDRGVRSKEVVQQVKELHEEFGVIVLKGNHDQLMIDALDKNEDASWLNNGGFQTVESYVGMDFFEESFEWFTYLRAKEFIKKNYSHHLDFLRSLPLYHETDSHIFVHAGLNPTYEDWKLQPESDFIWIRDIFFRNKTMVDKTVVFGHTPAEHLHGKSDIWFGEDKIGIDGACAYGRQLNLLEINESGYELHKVFKNKKISEEDSN
jgi:serine/threonine protein phosphatase 1